MRGEVAPASASEGKRSEQVTVHLTVEDKAILGAYANAKGFRSPAVFFRAKALSSES